MEGIKKHIQDVFNERRQSRKREKIDYELPDKTMCRPTVSGKTKPPLPAMLFDTEDKKDKTDEESNGNSTGDDDVNGQNDEIGGDTDVLENTDQEVTAVNLSIKSAKVVLLPYSGKKELDKISLDYLILVF